MKGEHAGREELTALKKCNRGGIKKEGGRINRVKNIRENRDRIAD